MTKQQHRRQVLHITVTGDLRQAEQVAREVGGQIYQALEEES